MSHKTLLLIDANALIHRAFHALPPLSTPDGKPIGAIYGLASMLIKILKDQPPDYIAAAFDRPEPTFRDKLFKDYKAHRPKAADELVSQIIGARELFQEFGISYFEQPGFEADDIIGKLVKMFRNEIDLKIVILTGDLDTLQLVESDRIVVQTPKRGFSEPIIYNEEAVLKRFELRPDQIPDYKGLVGDPSDNIPGVPGIGPKTAAKILKEYESLEILYKKFTPTSSSDKKLIGYKDQALFSKKLATINPDLPLETSLSSLGYRGLNTKTLMPYFTGLGFQSLIQRLSGQSQLFSNAGPRNAPSPNALIIQNAELALKNQKPLGDPNRTKVAFDWKSIFKILLLNKINVVEPIFDIKIGAWLIDPDQKDFSPEGLTKRFLQQPPSNNEDQALLTLFSFIKQKITDYQLTSVFEKIELPLIKILAAIENWGIEIDRLALKKLREKIDFELTESVNNIYLEAGCKFNINSPQQVASIIFKKLNLGGQKYKRTQKTGRSSTAENVLLELKDKHPIIELILNYRDGFKIKSTYIEPMLRVSEKDNKIHTNFLQTGTATGRLSSEKPNLQNIPQESKWAKDLRNVFVAKQGFSLISFDYSQLQLKLLAHVSGDQQLKEAFLKNLDIHKLTAAKVFGLPTSKINDKMRRIGKTLNFGVIYGMGPRTFAKTSNLPLAEAEEFIKGYFTQFPQVKTWQEKIKTEAKTFGYVKNLNGRRRWFLDIVSGQPRADYEIERAAINMPIQSLEADIIKIAMIESFKMLEKNRWLNTKAKLLLTIHDELLFELSDDILKKVVPAIKTTIEQVYSLTVPLTVDVKIGKCWGTMEKYNE